MARHHETGATGEQLATRFLTDKGYRILHSNWRSSHKEVDIIAVHDGLLVFVEIKTRRGLGFGFPEEAVTRAKQGHLKAAAHHFLEQFPQYAQVRFDVISIVLTGNTVTEFLHLEDAF